MSPILTSASACSVLRTAEARLKNVLEFSGSKKGNRKWQSARF
jgi:hypothetical protein